MRLTSQAPFKLVMGQMPKKKEPCTNPVWDRKLCICICMRTCPAHPATSCSPLHRVSKPGLGGGGSWVTANYMACSVLLQHIIGSLFLLT